MQPSTRPEPEPAEADTLAFARWLLEQISEDPLVRGHHRAEARRHLARLRDGPARVLTADDFAEA